MADLPNIRRRIRGIKNMRQITSAMEKVASVKMQRAIRKNQAGRPYSLYSSDLLSRLSQIVSPSLHPFLQKGTVKKIGLVIIASDRGLCGSYNTDVFKTALKFIGENEDQQIEVITLGKKAANFIIKNKRTNLNLIASFENFARDLEFADTSPISKLLIDGFLEKKLDQAVFLYGHFISTLKREIKTRVILPIQTIELTLPAEKEPSNTTLKKIEFKFEPSPSEVMNNLLPHLVRLQIYQIILESNASEHSARMVAMKNATDSAKDLIDDLQLTYNSIRQDTITREIAEIVGGMAAVEK